MSVQGSKSFSDFRGRAELSLGMENNNPGNLRPDSSKWKGKVGERGGFNVFSDIPFGIRAWLINYYTQITVRGRSNLKSFLEAYAPASENNTSAYISAVKAATGLQPSSPMPTDRDTVQKVMLAMFRHENTAAEVKLITQADIDEAYNRLSPVHQAFFLPRKIKSSLSWSSSACSISSVKKCVK